MCITQCTRSSDEAETIVCQGKTIVPEKIAPRHSHAMGNLAPIYKPSSAVSVRYQTNNIGQMLTKTSLMDSSKEWRVLRRKSAGGGNMSDGKVSFVLSCYVN